MTPATFAHQVVNQAVKRGAMPHPRTLACVDCASPANGYDHRDYSQPFNVEPVCRSCNHKRGQAANHDLGSHDATPFGRWVKAQPVGTSAALARKLGISRAMVAMWSKGVRPVSALQAAADSEITGISVKELRPGDWQRYWPEPAPKKRRTPKPAKV